jgi:hypothetical protein
MKKNENCIYFLKNVLEICGFFSGFQILADFFDPRFFWWVHPLEFEFLRIHQESGGLSKTTAWV